jgi:hypothetical protein
MPPRTCGNIVRLEPCQTSAVVLPSWYVALSQPGRWSVGGAMACGAIGALSGLIEAIVVYPVSSWFGVTLFVAMLAALAGLVLGLVTALALRRS